MEVHCCSCAQHATKWWASFHATKLLMLRAPQISCGLMCSASMATQQSWFLTEMCIGIVKCSRISWTASALTIAMSTWHHPAVMFIYFTACHLVKDGLYSCIPHSFHVADGFKIQAQKLGGLPAPRKGTTDLSFACFTSILLQSLQNLSDNGQ